ncbi:MAG: fatty acid desaturase [Gammaproteobacteria bacterium]|nr:fatty acid desaturase [Gammaproteobacteria bacterium]
MHTIKQKPTATAIQPSLSALFLISFLFPMLAMLFLLTGPHSMETAIAWMMPFWLILFADFLNIKVKQTFPPITNDHVYNFLLLILAIMQIANIWLLLEMAALLEWNSFETTTTSIFNLLAIKVIIGTSSSFSGIVTAHELIHKLGWMSKLLGRLLLSLVCYEHFYTEHLYGHHLNVGRQNDAATARFGESFHEYWLRTIPEQFLNAWKLETQRLNLQHNHLSTVLQHRVLQGLIVETGLMVLIIIVFGWTALLAFLLQAVAAVRKLEAVNYIEHWGLECNAEEQKQHTVLSWETDSWMTFHSLLGLSRHTDHHRHAGKPFQRLEYCPVSPQLPYGYFATIFLCIFVNKRFQAIARQQLQTLKLGPFRQEF